MTLLDVILLGGAVVIILACLFVISLTRIAAKSDEAAKHTVERHNYSRGIGIRSRGTHHHPRRRRTP